MLSIDTNILLHGFNQDSPQQGVAIRWLESVAKEENISISEFILAEFYGLLRNPAVLKYPLSAQEAGGSNLPEPPAVASHWIPDGKPIPA